MKKIYLFNGFLFAVVWIIFSYASGVFEHLQELPRGIHQSAQCDRAALAQNYYYGGFRFLYPEVNENRCIDGIVSCEMPLISFAAALLYKIFGYNELYFRLLSYIMYSLGMLALFFLFKTRLKTIAALALCLILHGSPILLFYGANFLPDISSLGLALIAWWAFYRQHIQHPYLPTLHKPWLQVAFILCLGLSVAIKTTSLIQWVSMLALAVLSLLPALKIQIHQRKKLFISLAWAFLIPLLWYLWSRHLAATHNSQYFMMSLPHSESAEAYHIAWLVYLANWPTQALTEPLIQIACIGFISSLLLKKYIQNELYFLSLINTLGSFAFLALMIEQFKYHDYYVICLFPALALNWLALADAASRIKARFWWVKLALFLALGVAVNYQFYQGKNNLEHRYTEGSYWEQSHHQTQDFIEFKKQIQALGVNRNHCVVAGYDVAPNNMLYLLHLRGHRIARDHGPERIQHIINGSRPLYIVSNDSLFTQELNLAVDSLELLCKYKQLELLRVYYK